MSTGEFGTEPPLDEIACDQGQQANDIQHQSPGGGPLGSVVVAGLPESLRASAWIDGGRGTRDVNGQRLGQSKRDDGRSDQL